MTDLKQEIKRIGEERGPLVEAIINDLLAKHDQQLIEQILEDIDKDIEMQDIPKYSPGPKKSMSYWYIFGRVEAIVKRELKDRIKSKYLKQRGE